MMIVLCTKKLRKQLFGVDFVYSAQVEMSLINHMYKQVKKQR